MTGASREMPRYKCHKEVWALKIAALEVQENGSAKIAPEDKGYAPFGTRVSWADQFHGDDNDLGYYVVYRGGYTSWSPTKAFEEGYTAIGGQQA